MPLFPILNNNAEICRTKKKIASRNSMGKKKERNVNHKTTPQSASFQQKKRKKKKKT
jgi:hypothetical protein